MKKRVVRFNILKLIIASILVSLLAAILADSLKHLTDFYENKIFKKITGWPVLFIVFPSIGITIIYFLRKYLFNNKVNKGIKEIYTTLSDRRNELPAFKIVSHYFNGFLTVIFGGSTGIEVSTVVSSAAIGAAAHKKDLIANRYKKELICAGVAAGIGTLFGSPIAGLLFAIEVIARKVTRSILLSTITAALISWSLMYLLDGDKLFAFRITEWRFHAIPYFIFLSIICGLAAVYFTKLVLLIKDRFSRISNNFIRVNAGALLVGISILILPQLYGDSYHAIPDLLHQAQKSSFSLMFSLLLAAIIILKPLVASLTLGAGGDGGVFAPSIVTGAALGILTAWVLNTVFHANVIPVNFALAGAGAMLSAAIYAPCTSVFLICSLATGGFILFIPVLVCNIIAQYAARLLCGYTVYTYHLKRTDAVVSH